MFRYLLISVFVAAGCSNPSTKNADPNNQVDGGGTDASNNTDDGGGGSDGGTVPDGGIGSDTGTSDTGPTTDGGSVDTGVDMSLPPSPCPTAAPAASSACTVDGLQCEYGTDPRESCRTRAECAGGTWQITSPRCEPLPPVTCPATREEASGALCDPMDAYCDYDGYACHCTNCIDGPVIQCTGDPTWMCPPPNPDATCPGAKPRLGEVCEKEAQVCDYKCGPDNGRTCTNGTWRSSDGGPCPISTAKVKRDIRYLSAAQLAEISAAVQAIPLAYWQYTDASLGRGQKLGFIIEDLPSATPAVDRDRLMVDLYGYTSMLVADAQAREQRMRALEARLNALEERGPQCAE
jgi:hypothetical protein